MRKEVENLYWCWFHYGLEHEYTQRAMIALFETLPEKKHFELIRTKPQEKE